MDMKASIPQPKDGVLDIAMYVPGKSRAPDGVTLHKLSSNESPLGASAKAMEAYSQAAGRLADYPDGSATKLKHAIACVHGLDPDCLMIGNGSDEILSLLAYSYLGAGDEAIFTQHAFLVYRIATQAAGATPVVVPETDFKADVDEILNAVTPRTRMVFLANPNNPTGTYLPSNEVRRLHAGLRSDIVLVLDGAYAEYVLEHDYEAGEALVRGASNVIMTRTFSKLHGLAALRVGWAFAPRHMVEVYDRVRGPFNVNAAAIGAGAAAMLDREHQENAIAHNKDWLGRVSEGLRSFGLEVTPSVGNFVLVHFPQEQGRRAADADAHLTSKGFVLRAVTGYGFPNALRMSIGSAKANLGALKALEEFLA